MKIAVVAPSNPLGHDVPSRVIALARDRFGDAAPEIAFHPQCFASDGHFAGHDALREDALVGVANDPAVDAIWFARGGYGANRIAERAIGRMEESAHNKLFLGYSDGGFVLAGLLACGIGRPAHAPMPADINRVGGEAAVMRTLDWLMASAPAGLERSVALNMIVLSNLLGTPLEPDFGGRILMLEEVDEPLYAIDRSLFHITSNANVRQCAGIMLGRCDPVTPNVPGFGMDEEAIARHWCAASGIPYLGRADIGHDAGNTVVPFG